MAKRFWLFKSDIEDYPISSFAKDKVTAWEGVRNYLARNYMQKEMSVGDEGIFYHSNGQPPAAVGSLVIAKAAQPDQLQFQKKSGYFDPKSTVTEPRWFCVEVAHQKTFASPVTLPAMKSEKSLSAMILLKKGNRLSITPLTEKEFSKICRMGDF